MALGLLVLGKCVFAAMAAAVGWKLATGIRRDRAAGRSAVGLHVVALAAICTGGLGLLLQPIGDALIHTKPLNGRGCTLAFIMPELCAEALAAHGDDPAAFAKAFDEGVEREVVPWYEATRAQDRDAIAVNQELARGEDPY